MWARAVFKPHVRRSQRPAVRVEAVQGAQRSWSIRRRNCVIRFQLGKFRVTSIPRSDSRTCVRASCKTARRNRTERPFLNRRSRPRRSCLAAAPAAKQSCNLVRWNDDRAARLPECGLPNPLGDYPLTAPDHFRPSLIAERDNGFNPHRPSGRDIAGE
jgi:hypothetical protein